jgi:tetratricopeptide (TPR) repeat protein
MKLVLYLMLIISSFGLRAQSVEQSKVFADDLYVSGAYQNALEVYNRVLFFDTAEVFSANIYPKIADAYYQTEQYAKANAFYDLAYNTSTDNILKNTYLLRKISGFLILKELDYAEIDFLSLDSTTLTTAQNTEKDLFSAIILFAKNDFETAEKAFLKISKDSTVVQDLFVKNKKISRISPKKAKNLSRVIPGLGQLYVGDVKNGLNSFLLTGGLMVLGIRGVLVNSLLDAAFSVGPWLQRYYKGGYEKAEAIAKAKILEKRFKIYNQLLDTLPNN